MNDLKTTFAGIIGAVVVALEPLITADEIKYERLVLAGCLAALGWFAKDAKKENGQ